MEDVLSGTGRIAVVGAGAMGAGIAQVAATAGHEVLLTDSRPGAAADAVARIAADLDGGVARGKATRAEADAVLARVHARGTEVSELAPCALVVEAVIEDLVVKQALFAELDAAQPPQTVLASNTSSLDVTAIADAVAPGRRPHVLGLHFFNPPARMRLVEVVAGRETGTDVLAGATALVRAWGRTPVRCASTPGFIVNRVARPFYGEAQRMLQDGVADPATLDLALTEHGGFRMGPFALADLVGQDVNLAVATSVWEQTGRDPRYEPTPYQQDLVRTGRLGRKSGAGVFEYAADRTPTGPVADRDRARALVGGPVLEDPVARTVAMIVNEAVDLVARGEASAEDVDTAMRLGTAYPRGPHAWLQELGAAYVVDVLRELDAARPGGRYRVSPALLGRG